VQEHRPCIIENAFSHTWLENQKGKYFNTEDLLNKFGGKEMSTQAMTAGMSTNTKTLQHFLDDESQNETAQAPDYIWEVLDKDGPEFSIPTHYVGKSSMFKPQRISSKMLSFGNTGSGFYWHVHG
jgi:hypothetical protein